MITRFLAAALVAIALAGCTATTAPNAAPGIASSAVLTEAGLAGRTVLFYDSGHGTQVEYFGTDGRVFLWYPGNARILPGAWKIERGDICFAYRGTTYNPVTKVVSTGNFQCRPFARFASEGTVESAPGDVLGLSRRTAAPFSLPRRRTSLQALAARL